MDAAILVIVTALCTAIGTILLAYLTSWFKTGGKIHSRLDELEKLVRVEKSVSQAKEDGRIDARKESKELISEVEKSIADTRNSSEFSYWKRKEDSEKLEQLFNLVHDGTLDLEKMVQHHISGISALISYMQNSDETNLVALFDSAEFECGTQLITARALLYSPIFYNIYLLKYKSKHTEQSLTSWVEISNNFISSNAEISMMAAQCVKQETKEKAIQHLKKVCNDLSQNAVNQMDIVYDARDELFVALATLSRIIYAD